MVEASVDLAQIEEQLRRVEVVTDASLTALGLEDLLDELLDRTRVELDADTAAIVLTDHSGGWLVASAARGLEEEVRQGICIPIGRGFAGRIASERRPVILDTVDHTTVYNPILVEAGIRTLLGVPLIVSDRVLGVLHVGRRSNRVFDDGDAQLLQVVADRAALAVQARRTEEDRATARALQRSLLPGPLPTIEGLDVATRYLPGERSGVGGDWFDLFLLPSGRVAAAIGDVVGHGVHSATVMGRLRSALRAFAFQCEEPSVVLGLLDRMAVHFEPGELATALYVVFSPDRREMVVSSAGHPPPVVAAVGGAPEVVELMPDLPLGMGAEERARRQRRVPVPAGASVYLYTDGVIERREHSIDVGLERLCAAAIAGPPELGCTRIVAQLLGDEGPDDDFALMALRFDN